MVWYRWRKMADTKKMTDKTEINTDKIKLQVDDNPKMT